MPTVKEVLASVGDAPARTTIKIADNIQPSPEYIEWSDKKNKAHALVPVIAYLAAKEHTDKCLSELRKVEQERDLLESKVANLKVKLAAAEHAAIVLADSKAY